MATKRQQYKSLYWAWKSMKQRCQNPRCKAYRNYGARGISVCDAWQAFDPFLEWSLSNGWEKGCDIDRIQNDGDYTPSNCRWVTRRVNVNNRRITVHLTINGITLPRSEWEEKAGIPRGSSKAWIRNHGIEYAEKRIKDAIDNGYTRNDYGYSHRRPIIHAESGRRFESVVEAAKAFGLAGCTISNAMRRGGSTSAGRFTWEEIG